MSRTVIAAVVAVVIAALTAIAFFITSTSFDAKIRKDAENQLRRAYQVVGALAQLESIDVANKAERLAADRSFVGALKSQSNSDRDLQARHGFTKFTSNDKEGDVKPDMIALVDAQGNLVAMNDMPSVVAKQWKKEGDKPGDTIIPALNVVLGNRAIISDIWVDQNRMMKIGVAPIIDPDAPVSANNPEGVVIIGAVVVAYAQTANQAQHDKALLGTEIAYYDGTRVVATSFSRGGGSEEDTGKAAALTDLAKSGVVSPSKGPGQGHDRRHTVRRRLDHATALDVEPGADAKGLSRRRRAVRWCYLRSSIPANTAGSDQAVHHLARPRRARLSRSSVSTCRIAA